MDRITTGAATGWSADRNVSLRRRENRPGSLGMGLACRDTDSDLRTPYPAGLDEVGLVLTHELMI